MSMSITLTGSIDHITIFFLLAFRFATAYYVKPNSQHQRSTSERAHKQQQKRGNNNEFIMWNRVHDLVFFLSLNVTADFVRIQRQTKNIEH